MRMLCPKDYINMCFDCALSSTPVLAQVCHLSHLSCIHCADQSVATAHTNGAPLVKMAVHFSVKTYPPVTPLRMQESDHN